MRALAGGLAELGLGRGAPVLMLARNGIDTALLAYAVMSRALQLEFDAREDPIVEVAAPESFKAADFLGASRRG